MKRALRINALILILFIRVASGKPFLKTKNLFVMERFAYNYLIDFTNANASTIRLSDVMEPSLLAQTYGIVDLMRGWARNETQEKAYRDAALNYLRVATMHRFLTYLVENMRFYVESFSYPLFSHFNALCAHLANWRWPVIFNPFLSFELMRFHTFSITVSPLNGTIPFVMSLANPNSIRFMENFPMNSTQTVVRSWLYSRPIPQAPQLNYNNEAEILFHAQQLVLKWCDYLKNEAYTSRVFLEQFSGLVSEATRIQFVNYARHVVKSFTTAIPDLIVMQLIEISIRFLIAEYQRHQCHPAKVLYASAYDAALQRNHVALIQRSVSLIERIDAKFICVDLTQGQLRAQLSDYFTLHVGYALDDVPDKILRFLPQCASTELVQNHYVYE